MVEVTVNARKAYIQKIKKLLSNKDKLTSQDAGDGRNKYQVEINKIKKQLKGFEGVSFGSLLKDVKKQEREGKFDRGAEDKTKKKLRKKMMDEKNLSKEGGVHAGSEADIKAELMQRIEDDPMAKKKKKKTGPGAR